MSVKITIDHREGALKEYLEGFHNIEWKLLPLGDIIIEKDEKPLLVIERKTLSDLAASIKDGRYKTQKAGLMSTFPKDIICYIIEGYLQYNATSNDHQATTCIGGISVDAIQSSIINTILRDKFHLFHTKDTRDTCDLIMQIFKRYSKNPEKYTMGQEPTSQPPPFVNKEKVKSKEECYIAQLCQVPGISMKTAQSIAERHATMSALLKSIQESNESSFEGIKTDCNGKKRAVSKSVIKNLLDYMV